MEHMSTFVGEMENDLSHGDNIYIFNGFHKRVNNESLK